mgnify:CR=1 FL=1
MMPPTQLLHRDPALSSTATLSTTVLYSNAEEAADRVREEFWGDSVPVDPAQTEGAGQQMAREGLKGIEMAARLGVSREAMIYRLEALALL